MAAVKLSSLSLRLLAAQWQRCAAHGHSTNVTPHLVPEQVSQVCELQTMADIRCTASCTQDLLPAGKPASPSPPSICQQFASASLSPDSLQWAQSRCPFSSSLSARCALGMRHLALVYLAIVLLRAPEVQAEHRSLVNCPLMGQLPSEQDLRRLPRILQAINGARAHQASGVAPSGNSSSRHCQ